jgi:putative hydrolase of the HAD superfamily
MSRPLPPPRAILIDLGDTLLHQDYFHPRAWAEAVCRLAVTGPALPLAEVQALTGELIGEVRWLRSHGEGLTELRLAPFLRLLHERIGLTLDLPPAEQELAFWQATSRMAPEPGVAEALTALEGRGLILGVVSNSMFGEAALRWELERHGLLGRFRFVMSSSDYGVRKPHRWLFTTAAARAGVAPGEAWFVGDSWANDVAGAAGAGLVPIWYNPRSQRGEAAADGPGPAAEVRSWAALLALLG